MSAPAPAASSQSSESKTARGTSQRTGARFPAIEAQGFYHSVAEIAQTSVDGRSLRTSLYGRTASDYCPGNHLSHLSLLGHLKRVVNLDTGISDGTFKPIDRSQ